VPLSYQLGVKIPAWRKAAFVDRNRGFALKFNEELFPLNNQFLRTHRFSFQLPNALVVDPYLMDCFLPYNRGEIMARGHSLNSAIPNQESEAEFPPEPWGASVTIRVKSMTAAQPAAPIPVNPRPQSWADVSLGAAPAVSADASSPVGYVSPNTGQYSTVWNASHEH
jgi:hypothetical protein